MKQKKFDSKKSNRTELSKRGDSPNIGISKSRTACKRCRLKKIKCDQEFPSCKRCAKLEVPCVSLDPATGKDIPRSYVFFLEDRLAVMMRALKEYGVDPMQIRGNIPATSDDEPFDLKKYSSVSSLGQEGLLPHNGLLADYLVQKGHSMTSSVSMGKPMGSPQTINIQRKEFLADSKEEDGSALLPEKGSPMTSDARAEELRQCNKEISALGTIRESSFNSFLGDSSGISFARLVFTATNFRQESGDDVLDEDIKLREQKYNEYAEAENNPHFDPLELPPRHAAEVMISRFFVDTNSQLPLLHRELFLKKYFEPIYGPWNSDIALASDQTNINTAFEIPTASSFSAHTEPKNDNVIEKINVCLSEDVPWYDTWKSLQNDKICSVIELPTKFHIPYFFLNIIFAIGHATQVLKSDITTVATYKRRATKYIASIFSSSDRLEALAGTLLMVIYSIMRPNVPGVWYTMGSVLRLTVDLGLHSEKINKNYDAFTRDIRRRLFWCVYSLDRQICSYFGRPFGIPEESITTRYPSLLDDSLITLTNQDVDDYSDLPSPNPSSKVIALAMYKIRRIQASIVRILYAPGAELPRRFMDLESWRIETHNELERWFQVDVPKNFDRMNCKYNSIWFDLNYHYSKSILYGLSPKCPTLNDTAFKIVLDSTKGTIDVFYNLCVNKKIGYTWVAVHNMFMTGMTYLYVNFYSKNNINDSQEKVSEYTEKVLIVLKNLIGFCESAKTCYTSYKILSSVVIKLKFMQLNDDNGIFSGSNTLASQAKRMSGYGKKTNVLGFDDSTFDHKAFNKYNVEEKAPFDIPLEEFFTELEKHSNVPQSDIIDVSETNPVINENVSTNISSAVNGQLNTNNQDIMDILFQVTSRSVWDEFFVRSGNGNEGESSYDFSNGNSSGSGGMF
ncbi:Ppr1p [Saccharomyces paradoxus]|uniref:Ppr1p n=1 Tax=Saccharomyces paradoxus TaxID=27291 RepID=A0A8B8UVK0_SACPA|nr:Ppr1 [Saccharomyces paradoxus]QHS74760.1 Ppr1 [Saccharomyces paradoxus]